MTARWRLAVFGERIGAYSGIYYHSTAGDRRSPLQTYGEVLDPGEDCRGGLRPPAGALPYLERGSGPTAGFIIIRRRATAGRPYRPTARFWILAKIVGAVFDRPLAPCRIWREDRRAPTTGLIIVRRRATAGRPYRPTARFWILAKIVGAVFDRPLAPCRIWREDRRAPTTGLIIVRRRATAGRPYRPTTGFVD